MQREEEAGSHIGLAAASHWSGRYEKLQVYGGGHSVGPPTTVQVFWTVCGMDLNHWVLDKYPSFLVS